MVVGIKISRLDMSENEGHEPNPLAQDLYPTPRDHSYRNSYFGLVPVYSPELSSGGVSVFTFKKPSPQGNKLPVRD